MTSFKTRRLAQYLNQTVDYQAYAGSDDYGDPDYAEATTIAARIEQKPKLVTGMNGETIVATATAWTLVPLKPFDKLNGAKVLNVSVLTDRDGSTVGYESYLDGGANGA